MLPHRPSRLRRVLRAVVMVGIVGGCIGGMAWLAASGVVEDAARDWLKIEETHKLSFTVSEQPGFRFSVEVPDSWMPANVDSDSWRDTRDALMAAFPVADGEVSVWEQVETSFSAAVRDPVYGVVRPQVRIVETDRDRLSDSGVVAALTLHEIVPLPAAVEGQPSDACGRLRALEQQFNANGALTSTPTNEVIDSALATRGKSGDCVFYVQRRRTEQAAHEVILPISLSRAPSATQDVMLAVPVGAERYAVWHLTFADSAAGDYQSVVERVIGSLVYVPQD